MLDTTFPCLCLSFCLSLSNKLFFFRQSNGFLEKFPTDLVWARHLHHDWTVGISTGSYIRGRTGKWTSRRNLRHVPAAMVANSIPGTLLCTKECINRLYTYAGHFPTYLHFSVIILLILFELYSLYQRGIIIDLLYLFKNWCNGFEHKNLVLREGLILVGCLPPVSNRSFALLLCWDQMFMRDCVQKS